MNERILITGAGGFIGRHVAKRLFELGYRIICIDFESNFQADDEG
ncbi:LPS biosynthesis protein WbpP, partial [bacterium]|nr:LPS biosynthesis protein WbpP [bacterium]